MRLPTALQSVAFCDQVIVVDSGSTDRTLELARAAGALVLENPWPGFAAQRNAAVDQAACDWILEVDADERVTPQLRDEILAFLAKPPPAEIRACVLPLRDHFLGRWLGPSTKYPRYRMRLFRRGAYRHDEGRLVHEGLVPIERVWAMRHELRHEMAASWREALVDAWCYARLEATQVAPLPGAGAYARAIVVRPTAKLVWRAIVEGGWHDGLRGLAKIGLECATDATVWTRRALGAVPKAPGDGERGAGFGRIVVRAGPVRLVALATGERARERASEWLRDAHEAGADVALVTDGEVDGGDWLHVHRIRGAGPLSLIRGLDAVVQMRQPDGLLVGGPLAPRIAPLLARLASAVGPPARLDEIPADVVAQLRRIARP
jgi:hypothetical protein